MVGKQKVYHDWSENILLELHEIILQDLRDQLEEYKRDESKINHTIITSIPLKINLMNKYKVHTSKRNEIRDFIKSNFSSKTIIPITVNELILGKEIRKVVFLMVKL